MACREGHNSVIVSLAYFLTKSQGRNSRSDDALVKKAFHALKIERAREHRTGAQIAAEDLTLHPDERHAMQQIADKYPPADTDDVLAFLEEQKYLVRHDPRIPDRKRDLLVSKLERAEQDVRTGTDVPSVVIFDAWRNLRERVEQMRADGHTTLDVTDASGETVTREDVEAAVAARDTAVAELEAMYHGKRSANFLGTMEQQIEAAKTRVIVAEAELHSRVMAYDTTDAGFRELLAQSDALSDYIPLTVSERQRIARDERHRIVGITEDAIAEQAHEYRVLEREYMRARAIGDQDTIARLSSSFDRARFNYSRAVLMSGRMRPVLDNEQAWEQSWTVWALMEDSPNPAGPTRREQWIAVETFASLRDARLVQSGVLTEDAARRRARDRHECRKIVLAGSDAAA